MSKSSLPPRAAPYQPPLDTLLEVMRDEWQQRDAELRRWLLTLALSTAAVVLVTVIGGIWIVTRTVRQSQIVASSGIIAGPASTPSSLPISEEQAASQLSTVTPAPIMGLPKLEETDHDRDKLLEVLGGLTASHLYQCYLNLGLLVDTVAAQVYDPAEGQRLLTTVLSLLDTVEQQLARLTESALDPEDQQRVLRVRDLIALLRLQGKELRVYWETPATDKDQRLQAETRCQRARQQSWNALKELLGIEDNEDE